MTTHVVARPQERSAEEVSRPRLHPPSSATVHVDAPVRLALRPFALIGVPVLFAAVVAGRSLVWPHGRPVSGAAATGLVVLSASWAVPLLTTLVTVVGYALFRRQRVTEADLQPISVPVAFRVVSRGHNAEAVRTTVRNIVETMHALPLFAYSVEVVTDLPVPLPALPHVENIVVPGDYETPRGSRYKARALHYALEASSLQQRGWVMHLDEESHITPSLVIGICGAILEEDHKEVPRIGQGLILYHRNLREDTFFALADSIRTGDDLGRFYVQHRLGVTLFGLHGSFVLVRNDVERRVGFDVGPQGSITEDAFWALEQMHLGARCRWVDGVVVEQAPQSVKDFLKQRRRWFVGLLQVVRHAPVPLRWRLPLAFSVLAWSTAWLGVLYTYINVVTGYDTPKAVWIAGTFALAVYAMQYLAGLRVNMDHRGIRRRRERLGLYIRQVLFIPIFALMEATGVLYGIVRPEKHFHVIDKHRNPVSDVAA